MLFPIVTVKFAFSQAKLKEAELMQGRQLAILRGEIRPEPRKAPEPRLSPVLRTWANFTKKEKNQMNPALRSENGYPNSGSTRCWLPIC